MTGRESSTRRPAHTRPVRAPRQPSKPARVGERYAILDRCGRGSFSDVFRARDLLVDRIVALKRFHGTLPESFRRALTDEFLILSQLEHPSLPRVHDFGVDAEGRPFFTMDFLAGPSLGKLLSSGGEWARRAMEVRGFARSLVRLLSALAFIHARGILHGDIKPSNVLYAGPWNREKDSGVRLVDFGLSRALGPAEGARGTPRYMAPEVLAGGAPDVLSDLYSLGLVVSESLEKLGRGAKKKGPLLDGLSAVGSRLAARERGMRYGSAAQAWNDVLRLLEKARDASSRDLRKTFVFHARPLSWAAPLETLSRRILEARTGRGGVVLAKGIHGRAARSTAASLRAEALTAGMGVATVQVARSSEGDPISSAIETLLAGRDSSHEHSMKTLPAAALASRLAESAGAKGRTGMLVLLEGMEALPGKALESLERFVMALGRSRCLLVGMGARPQDAGERDGASAIEIVDFPPLGPADIEAVLEEAFGKIQPHAATLSALRSIAGGDFAALDACLAEAVRSGAIHRTSSGWIARPGRLRRPAAPALLDALPPLPTRLSLIAERLGVLGVEIDEAIAVETLETNQSDLRRACASLRSLGYLRAREADAADNGWTFAFPALAETLASRLKPSLRRETHRRALAAVERSGGRGDLLSVARHLEGSGDRPRAAGILLAEGEVRLEREDAPGACHMLSRALAIVPPDQPETLGRIRYRLALALQATGLYRESEPLLEALAAGGVPLPAGVLSADVDLAQALNLEASSRFGPAVERLERALGSLPPDDHRRRALFLRQIGFLRCLYLGESPGETSEEIAERAENEALASGDLRALAACKSLRGHIANNRLNRIVEADVFFREAETLYARAGSRIKAAVERCNAGYAWLRRDPEKGRALLLATEEEATALGLNSTLAVLASNLANLEKALGRWDEAERLYRLAIDIGEQIGSKGLRHVYANYACQLMDRGHFAEARTYLSRAAKLYGVSGSGTPYVTLNLARLSIRMGLHRDALEKLRRAQALVSPATPATWMNYNFYLSEAHAALEHLEEAERASQAAMEAAEKQEVETFKGEAFLYKAYVERKAGRRGSALQCLDRAEEYFKRTKQGHYLARTRLERAEALVADPNESERGVEAAAASAEFFSRCGMTPFFERAEKLHREFEASVRRAKEGPGQLQTLYRLAGIVGSTGDLPSLLERILEASLSFLRAHRGLIFLVPENGSDQEMAASHLIDTGEHAGIEKISRGILRRALKDDRPLVSGDAASEKTYMSMKSVAVFKIRSFICAPLRFDGAALGAIYLDHPETNRFTPEDREFLRAFTMLAGPAIAVARRGRALEREIATLRRSALDRFGFDSLIGSSPRMSETVALARRCAGSTSHVVLVGETGAGKDHFARAIHFDGALSNRPFITLPGSDLTGSLVDTTIFGIEKGAASEIVARPGCFERANGGTLYLDGIADLPLESQAKLLRVIEEKKVTRVGSSREIDADVRLVVSSTVPLKDLVARGLLREDLFYRLNVLTIPIPPLRSRREDIPLLLKHFISIKCARHRKPELRVTPTVEKEWCQAHWRGNVRELENAVETAVVAAAGDTLPSLREISEGAGPGMGILVEQFAASDETLDALIAAYCRRMVERCGSKKQAAKSLGIVYRTLEKYLNMALPANGRKGNSFSPE